MATERLTIAELARQHTGGPWNVEERGERFVVHGSVKRFGLDWNEPVCKTLAHDQEKADAHLIAAAPDLLACLEEAERMADFDVEQTGVVDRWRAAIARARGEI